MPVSGSIPYVQYGWELVAFGTEAVTYDKVFGHGQKVTVNRRRNVERIWGLGNRNSTVLVPKLFEGTATIEFALANGYWTRAVLGSAPVDAGAGPFTHTYSEANTLQAFSVENGFELGATDRAMALLGCRANTATITAAVNEIARVRLDVIYQTEAVDTTLDATPATEAEDPFIFQQATLEFPTGTVIDHVQSVEFAINNNLEGLPGLGNFRINDSIPKNREYNCRCTVAFDNFAETLQLFYGAATGPVVAPAETATLTLTFTNSGAGVALRSYVITCTGVRLDEESLPQDPAEIVKEDFNLLIRNITSIVYTNNTAVAL